MPTTLTRHAATWERVPTSIQTPIIAIPGVNFVVGTAPTYKFADGAAKVGKSFLCNTYNDFVNQVGFSKDFFNYTCCEHADAAFRLYGVYPVIYHVVGPDPLVDRRAYPPTVYTLLNGRVTLAYKDFIRDDTLIVSDGAGLNYVAGTDYIFSEDVNTEDLVITRIEGGAIGGPNQAITVEGFRMSPENVTEAWIIGGVDPVTDKHTGIAAIEEVFGQFGIIPGILCTPRFANRSTVFATAIAAVSDINGCFKARYAADVNVLDVNTNPNDAPAWKVANNMIHERADLCYPRLGLGTDQYWFSSHWGPLQQLTDATIGGGIPYASASNKRIQIDRSFVNGMGSAANPNGDEIILSRNTAEYLNVQAGIVVPLRWGTFGWRSFGNGTSLVPNSTDTVTTFSCILRMFDYVGNTMVLTTHATWLDLPGNRRAIDSIVNSFNAWGASLQAQGAVLAFRVEFRQDENLSVDLLAGKFTFHVYFTPPPPLQWVHFLLEYDVSGLETLFE